MARHLCGPRLRVRQRLPGHRRPAQRRASRPPHRTRGERGRAAEAHRRAHRAHQLGRRLLRIRLRPCGDHPRHAHRSGRYAACQRNRAFRHPWPRVLRRAAAGSARLWWNRSRNRKHSTPSAASCEGRRSARDDRFRPYFRRFQPDSHLSSRCRRLRSRRAARARHVAVRHRPVRGAGARREGRALRDRRLDVQHVRHGAARRRGGDLHRTRRPCGPRRHGAGSDQPHRRQYRVPWHRHRACAEVRLRLPGPGHPEAGHGARRACQVPGRTRGVGARRQGDPREARLLHPRRRA